MILLHPPRECPVYAPKGHKHLIFGFGRILAFFAKKYFAPNVPYVCRYLSITLGYESSTHGESLIDISSLQKTRKF